MKKILLACAVLGLLLAVPVSRGANAAELYAPNSGIATITQSVKNLYTAGGTIDIDTKVLGDAIVAGSTINVNQDVEQTLMAAGQSIVVKGSVGQNARLAGNTIAVRGNIGQDLLAASSVLTIEKDAIVSGDVISGASQLTIDGTVKGYVKGAADEATINGTVNGDVNFKDVNKLTIGENAVISGKLSYRSDAEANIASGAQIKGGVEFDQRTPYKNAWIRFIMVDILTLAALGKLVAGFLLLVILVYGLPAISQNIVTKTTDKPLVRMGIGFLALVATPIAFILLLVSVVGSSIAGLVGILYILLIMLAAHYATIIVGQAVRKFLNRSAKEIPLDWLTALTGIIASSILVVIPFVGGLVMFLVFLASLGGVIQAISIHRKQ